MVQTKSRIELKAAGDAALDRFLSTRQPSFLSRNLRTILDRHEEDLAISRRPGSIIDMEAADSDDHFRPFEAGSQLDTWNHQRYDKVLDFIRSYDAKAAQRRKKDRDAAAKASNNKNNGQSALTPESIEKHDQAYTPRTVLAIKRLVLRNGQSSAIAQDESDSDSPSWLHRKNASRPLATCTVSVFEDVAGDNPPRLATKSATGIISSHDGHLHITFPNDFDLHIPSLTLAKPQRDWSSKRSVPAVLLVVKIKNSGRQFASYISPPTLSSSLATTAAKERTIFTDFARLTISANGQLSKLGSCELFELIGGTNPDISLQSELDVVLAWKSRSKSTPLAEYNKAVNHLFEDRPLQLPTPNSSIDLSPSTEDIRITYLFVQAQQPRRMILKNLDCPLCQKNVGVTSFQRLCLHWKVSHDYFEFEVENAASPCNSSSVHRVVTISLAPKIPGRANGASKSKVMLDWVAPRKPFDLDEYLAGSSPWEAPRPKRGRPPKLVDKKGKKLAASMIPQPVAPPLPPEQVPDLVVREPTLHPIPDIRGEEGQRIQFYRTASKKPFRPGELAAESDEEIDDSWLMMREQQHLRRLKVINGGLPQPLDAVTREFILDWNMHITREQKHAINGDRLKREGVIRFARLYRHKLADAGWRQQFDAKLQRLLSYDLLDHNDIRYCLRREVNGDVEMQDATAVNEPATNKDNEDEGTMNRFRCVCGNKVVGKRDLIYCENPICPREAYHLSCFELKTRPAGWLCPECAKAPDLGTSSGTNI